MPQSAHIAHDVQCTRFLSYMVTSQAYVAKETNNFVLLTEERAE